MNIPFNKTHTTGKELDYINQVITTGKLSGNGAFTKKCQEFFEQKFGFKKALLTTSCTDALEMAAILANIQPDDEVIIPSYTFVSTANAFVLRGAKIVFADSNESNPNIDPSQLEALITPKTKAIVVVHYAGVACDMDLIMAISKKHNLFVIEDAAQAIDSYYKGKPLGSFGHFAAFSFHETKNIISGEGGMLVINDENYIRRAEIIWEKGTNRAEFFRGEINKYEWVDMGSSFLTSELIAAFLFTQLEHLTEIQEKRKLLWNLYFENLSGLENINGIKTPILPEFATNNAHVFYLQCQNLAQRDRLIKFLKENGISAVFHYISLHTSKYYLGQNTLSILPNSEKYSDCLVRLPLFYDLELIDVKFITEKLKEFK